MVNMIDTLHLNYIFVSVNYIENENVINKEINQLYEIINTKEVMVFIGGNAINEFKNKYQVTIPIINNMKELADRFN